MVYEKDIDERMGAEGPVRVVVVRSNDLSPLEAGLADMYVSSPFANDVVVPPSSPPRRRS